MNNPLALARRPHAVAFAGIVAWLKRDPALKRIVNVWRAWEGNDDDATPWGSDDDVGVRVTPKLGPAERFAPNDDGSWVFHRPLILTIEGFVNARAAIESMQLSDALGYRMTPTGDTSAEFDLKLAEWCVMEVLELQPCDITAMDETGAMIVGRYQLEMHF